MFCGADTNLCEPMKRMDDNPLHDLLDETIHQRTRLAIMAALTAAGVLEFNELRSQLSLTDGNLSTHLASLERAGYVEITKAFRGKKPLTERCHLGQRPQGHGELRKPASTNPEEVGLVIRAG